MMDGHNIFTTSKPPSRPSSYQPISLRRRCSSASGEDHSNEFQQKQSKSFLGKSRSIPSFLSKSLSLRRRSSHDSSNGSGVKEGSSTTTRPPGIVKIYSSDIPGSTYKAILIAHDTSVNQVINEALTKFNIQEASNEYFLYDVIGKIDDKVNRVLGEERQQVGIIEIDARELSRNLSITTLLRVWRVADGFTRRFELRRKEEPNYKAINQPNSTLKYQSKERQGPDGGEGPTLIDTSGKPDEERKHTVKVDKYYHQSRICPCLITLKGAKEEQDALVYNLDEGLTTVGQELPKYSMPSFISNMVLCAADIRSPHCQLVTQNDKKEAKKKSCYIIPCKDSEVFINNVQISGRTLLNNGDILTFGEFYMFLFKNGPIRYTSKAFLSINQDLQHGVPKECKNTKPLLPRRQSFSQTGIQTNFKGSDDKQCETLNNKELHEHHLNINIKLAEFDFTGTSKQMLQMKRILYLHDVFPGSNKLAMAQVICTIVSYSLRHNHHMLSRQLLLQIGKFLQSSAWDKVGNLNKSMSNISSLNKSPDASSICLQLQQPFLWLSNSLEMYHFMRTQLPANLQDAAASLPSATRISIAVADAEIVGVLEDMAMFIFQQAVFYITKIVQLELTTFLYDNPFLNGTGRQNIQRHATHLGILGQMDALRQLLLEYQVHLDIISQFFTYVFFFLDISIFNMVLSEGEHFFNWSHGVVLLGNLDILEEWSSKNGLQREARSSLLKINSLATLLATPKNKLIKMDWEGLRREFHRLAPQQLFLVLQKYDLNEKPRFWAPSSKDRSHLNLPFLEDFHGYPPLVLPGKGYKLDIDKLVRVENDIMYKMVDYIINGDHTSHQLETGVNAETPFEINNIKCSEFFGDTSLDTGDVKDPYVILVEEGNGRNFKSSSFGRFSIQNDHGVSSQNVNYTNDYTKKNSLTTNQTVIPNLHQHTFQPIEPHKRTPVRNEEQIKCLPLIGQGKTNIITNEMESDQMVFSYGPTCDGLYDSRTPNSEDTTRKPVVEISPRSPFKKYTSGTGENTSDHGNVSSKALLGSSPFDMNRTSKSSFHEDAEQDAHNQDTRNNYQITKHTCEYHDKNETVIKNSLTFSTSLENDPGRKDNAFKAKDDIQTKNSCNNNNINNIYIVEDAPIPSSGAAGYVPIGINASTFHNINRNIKELTSSECKNEVNEWSRDSAPIHPDGRVTLQQSSFIQRNAKPTLSSLDMYIVQLQKKESCLGIGLIDGLNTHLRRPGMYVRTLVPGQPAALEGHIQIADRLLAVNDESIVGYNYQWVMSRIAKSSENVKLLFCRTDPKIKTLLTNN